MAETEMVERVAKAMYDERLRRAPAAAAQFDLPWGALADDERRPWLFLARAAIKEMRKPTKEMVEVGYTEINNNIDSWNYDSGSGYAVEDIAPTATWQAMIDAAISPPSKD